ncbi:MAG: hypothetical protein GY786_00035, partial [Proteobacteria bacterium]|nr:hypothetical protein [Pseudomonadota bacterium]
MKFLKYELNKISRGNLKSRKINYNCWQGNATIQLRSGSPIQVKALLFSPLSPENGIIAQIKDIGEGSEEDFKHIGRNEIKGKVVLVRHSYMFSSSHVHR